MVSRETERYGRRVETLEGKEYRELEGLLRENLPMHVGIEIKRVGDKIELWSRYPVVMRKALRKTRDMHQKYGLDAMAKVVPSYEHKVSEPVVEVQKRKPKKKKAAKPVEKVAVKKPKPEKVKEKVEKKVKKKGRPRKKKGGK